jgi:D-glycero-D-manno-heptose 1,7-bisphosphate phosphatase
MYKIKKALILDLDGTIRRNKNDHKSFINNAEEIELIPGIVDAIAHFKSRGYLIGVMTNQGGVAFGFKTEEDVHTELIKTLSLFPGGVNPFNCILVATQHEGGKVSPYNMRSMLRKPAPGMFAIFEYNAGLSGFKVDWDRSYYVGDRDEDKQAAAAANIAYYHIDAFLINYQNLTK